MDTLAEILERDGPLPVRDAIGWTIRTALTVWLLHGEGVVHGSLSLAAVEVASPRCDGQGRLRPARACPERPSFHDLERGPDGEPSGDDDIWALGVMLYVLLTGEHPYPEGVSRAHDGERVKMPKPLALHDGHLDVMQPILDRFLDPAIPPGARSVEEVVGALRDFSPAIADVPPLDCEAPDRAAGATPASASRDAAASWPAWVWVATIALPLAFGMALGLRWMDGDDPSLAPSAPSGAVEAPTMAPEPYPAASEGPAPAPASPPAATASSPPPPSATASSLPSSSEDMLACVGALFDSRSFVAKPMTDFPCRERDARKAEAAVRQTIIEATGGKVTSATSEWAGLQWYRPAAVAVLRGRCCNGPPPMEGPPLLRLCKLDQGLAELSSASAQRSEKKLASAMDTYRRAIACASAAGGQKMLRVEGKPTAQQAALFVKMLSRLRP